MGRGLFACKATTQGPLIAISSPTLDGARCGRPYRKHYGPEGDPSILVAQGATRDFNPDLPQSIIDKAMDRDLRGGCAEYMAEFSTDVEGFITREAVEACVTLGVRERPPERKHSYVCFVDPSGGSSDAFTLGNRPHRKQNTNLGSDPRAQTTIHARNKSWRSSPRSSGLIAARKFTVTGMEASGPREQFRKHGVNYEPSEKPKSELYRDLLPLINSRRC